MRKTIVGQGATGYVLKKHIPVVNVDPAFDLSFIPDDELGAYRVMASLPLFADDQMIGAVSIYSSKLDYFQDEHIRLLETVSHIAADAINIALQHAEAESYALTDPMTGLPNSRSLRAQFEKEVVRANRGSKRFQLLVMDLDGFKSVNDTYGHKLGDAMLKAVGGVISGQLREYDFLARYGGDEFIAIVPETDSEGAESLLERITESVDSFRLAVGNGLAARVGISLGSSSYPADGETLDGLIEAADKQMYLAKENNRKRLRGTDGIDFNLDLQQDGNGYIPTPANIEEPKVLSRSVS
jgi:diguanylate cyclase (GGDEF)-like protein